MAWPEDSLRPFWVVKSEMLNRHKSGKAFLRALNSQLRSEERVAHHNGQRKPKAFWVANEFRPDPDNPFGFAVACFDQDGARVHGDWEISDPRPEPTQVELRPVRWLGNLLGRVFRPRGETEAATATEVASVDESDEPQTSEAWLRWAVGKWPQKTEEGPAAYARRLQRKPKAREFWKDDRSLYTKLYEYELVRKKGG
jgi:hypothetical protein